MDQGIIVAFIGGVGASLVSAIVSVIALTVSKRAEERVVQLQGQQSKSLAEHSTAFMALHTRRVDIISKVYSGIIDLDSLIRSWLHLNEVIERQKQLAEKVADPQFLADLQELKQRIESMERQSRDAYKKMVDGQSALLRYYRRNRVWLSKATCEKLDEWMKPQSTFVERMNPEAHSGFLDLAKRVDALGQDMLRTSAELGLPQEPETSLEEQLKQLAKQYEVEFLPLINKALHSVEADFRSVLRVG